jgi:hypothetical protein
MVILRAGRRAALPALIVLLAAGGCSKSSPPSGGAISLDGGGAEADTVEDSSAPTDGTTDSSAADGTAGNPDEGPPVDAAPVDAAYACAHPATIADCGYCLTQTLCVNCATTNAPAGAPTFKEVFECIRCTACYTACGGSSFGCTKPPAMDPCDTGAPSEANCTQCEACAVAGATDEAGAGTCNSQATTCTMSPACAELLGGVENACKYLP